GACCQHPSFPTRRSSDLAADASFELLLREEVEGRRLAFFETESWRTIVDTVPGEPTNANAEATVKMHIGQERIVATGEGNGPVRSEEHTSELQSRFDIVW